MRTERPLSLLVRPRTPAFTRKFNADAMGALAEFSAISVTSREDGLLLQALWEPDLEQAIDHLERVLGVPLALPMLQINYVLGEPILEPVLAVTVVCPEMYTGDVIADLHRRRGLLTGLEDAPGGKQVLATVPLAELIGYVVQLRAMTRRSGSASAVFFDYQPVPPGSGPKGPVANVMRA